MATKHKPRAAALYDEDFYVWTRGQADAIRAGRRDELDVANLVEEIEDLGSERWNRVRSRSRAIIGHLLAAAQARAAEAEAPASAAEAMVAQLKASK
jgi:hypothetical protein